jgi:hypothetical protein
VTRETIEPAFTSRAGRRRRARAQHRLRDQRPAAGARDDARAATRPPARPTPPRHHALSDDERATVRARVDTHERNDLDGLLSPVREDLRSAVPPDPGVQVTSEPAVGSWSRSGPADAGTATDAASSRPVNPVTAVDLLHIVDGEVAALIGSAATDELWRGLPDAVPGPRRDRGGGASGVGSTRPHEPST